MVTQKTWTDLLGKPQGNESVDGKDIVREVDLHHFKRLWSFDSNEEANRIYTYWTVVEPNNEVVENLRKDLMLIEKNKFLLQSYLNLGGDNNFFSINNDRFGSGGEEVIRLFSECILLIEHCLENADEGHKIDKKFMFEKLDLYDIEEYLAERVMPNVFNTL